MVSYKIRNSKGDLVDGSGSTPANIARKAMRKIFKDTGKKEHTFTIVNTETGHEYKYKAVVRKLKEPKISNINGNIFKKEYDIELQKI